MVGCEAAMVGCEAAMVGCEAAMVGCEAAMVGCEAAMVGCEVASPFRILPLSLLGDHKNMKSTNKHEMDDVVAPIR